MLKRTGWLLLVAGCFWGPLAGAATIALLSTGAVEPGIRIAAGKFEKATGHVVSITYRTAPEVREDLKMQTSWDLAIATPATVDEYTRTGLFAPGAITLGRVGVGVAVRQGAPLPDISTPEAIKRAVLDAEGVVFSRGSTGQYTESMLKALGVFERAESRIVRTARGTDAMERLKRGKDREIGFGALTEISEHTSTGIVLVGALPGELQSYTTYTIGRLTKAANAAAADAFLAYLASPAGRADFRAAGIVE